MKLITRFDLASRSDSELHALYRDIFNAFVQSEPDSTERRNALASLDNIESELHHRLD